MAENLLIVSCAAFTSSLGAFLFGLDVGYIAPILESAEFKRDVAHLPNWNDSHSVLPARDAGFIVSVFSLGCVFMSLPPVSSYFLDFWGRRTSILLGSPVFIVGCIIQASCQSVAVMCLGRFISGCSIGLLSSVVPLYQSEVAPARLRGALTSTYQIMISAGIFAAAYFDLVLLDMEGGWRTVILMQIIPAGIILMAMPFLPRSPRWLVRQGRLQEAQDVLEHLRGKEQATSEYKSILDDVESSMRFGDPSWAEVFTGRVGQLVAIGAALQLLQQFVGMNAFMYFGPRIFESMLGASGTMLQTFLNAANFAFTLPALFLADCAGRGFLLTVGGVSMTCACIVIGIVGTMYMVRVGDYWSHTNAAAPGVIVGCVFLFVVSFACTWGPIVWVYCCEIFPLKYRARCVGVTTTMNWVGNFFIAQLTPMLLESFGFSTFFIFALFGCCAFVLGMWLPETKGLALEEIGQIFDARFGREADQRAADTKATYGSVDLAEESATGAKAA